MCSPMYEPPENEEFFFHLIMMKTFYVYSNVVFNDDVGKCMIDLDRVYMKKNNNRWYIKSTFNLQNEMIFLTLT